MKRVLHDNEYPVIDMKLTGKNIHDIMRKKGIGIKDVCEYLGLSACQSVYHWIEGKSLPSVDNLYALSKLFQLSIDEIIVGNYSYDINPDGITYDRMKIYYYEYIKLKAG